VTVEFVECIILLGTSFHISPPVIITISKRKKKMGRMQDCYDYISLVIEETQKSKVTPLLEQRRKQRKSLTNTHNCTTLYSYTSLLSKTMLFSSYPVAAYAASPGLGSASIPLACIFAAEHLLMVGELLEIASVK